MALALLEILVLNVAAAAENPGNTRTYHFIACVFMLRPVHILAFNFAVEIFILLDQSYKALVKVHNGNIKSKADKICGCFQL